MRASGYDRNAAISDMECELRISAEEQQHPLDSGALSHHEMSSMFLHAGDLRQHEMAIVVL